MESMNLFYIGLMIILVIGDSIAIGKNKEKKLFNWMQIIIFVGVLGWYVYLMQTNGLTSLFFFVTTLLFLCTFAIELGQFVLKKEKKQEIIFFLLSMVPIVGSIGILSGFFF